MGGMLSAVLDLAVCSAMVSGLDFVRLPGTCCTGTQCWSAKVYMAGGLMSFMSFMMVPSA